MGAAYRGEDLETKRIVAVKELIDRFESPEERDSGIGNFLAEMRVLKSIRHPQIPRILDHFVEKRGFFFVLDFVEGKDLTSMLEDGGRSGLPEEDVIRIGVHVCRVLRYLHERPEPIVHRDIKPSNIMQRKRDGRIMLLDFGIAQAAMPKAGMMIGTRGYAPIEQHRNQVEPRSDVYALGATLHELATGQRPDEESFYFPPPNELRVELSIPFCEVVIGALGFEPGERFESAAALEEALQSLLPYPVPENAADPFAEASAAFWKNALLPILADVKRQHLNECQTDVFPDYPDFFSFTLGSQIPHSLIVQVEEEKEAICFYSKEGLLSKTPLGEIRPADPGSHEKARSLVERFLSMYEASNGFQIS